jgi:hypothetical protein
MSNSATSQTAEKLLFSRQSAAAATDLSVRGIDYAIAMGERGHSRLRPAQAV